VVRGRAGVAAPAPAAGAATGGPQPHQFAHAAVDLSLGLALLLALAGGALLNLMPCVFPVLSLKVLGFAHHAHDRKSCWPAAWPTRPAWCCRSWRWPPCCWRCAPVANSWAGASSCSRPASWWALAALFTLIGLNLAGVFEFGNGAAQPPGPARRATRWSTRLLTGVLAVAVASPCTAPFMGASLGAAVTLPAWQALLVFAALGLGMALPYLAASAWPALARDCCRGRVCGWRTSRP
jgi:thiol:disulfide interchange protein